MSIQQPIASLFRQIAGCLASLTDEQYNHPSSVMSMASIGQHVRHIIEFFVELENGYQTGRVNYDDRKRDNRIETDRLFAIGKLNEVVSSISARNEKDLVLSASIFPGEDLTRDFRTNYSRELFYNLEHTVHHMAFIRSGVLAVSSVELPRHFGVAASTIKAQLVCAS